ncbi:MAG: GNAT family N-acetyltransferase [Gammaproteobacteria bacterium]|nr:MAG: GNAT family N-acetyltransferase [Gammaproteobacteria bacterium]TLZ41800.1 MAG: GNAT family N-acetyltransferase [Gammaproteobacteria bacterium]
MGALTLRRWGVDQWLGNAVAWKALLACSSADPLFLSWEWLTHWWQCYGGSLGRAPDILAFYRGEDLVGLAPLYHRLVMRGVLLAHSVQVIGLSWRDSEPLISEYLDVIAAPQDLGAVRHACLRLLLDEPAWTELVIGYSAAGQQWRDAFARLAPARGHYVRELDRSVSYQADLAQGFGPYLRDLGQSTRRSLWNLRRRLTDQGAVSLEFVAAGEIDRGFSDLNRLHQLRWKRPAFTGKRLAFHRTLASRLATHAELAFSRLRVGGDVVSVLYDIRKGARQYNIKMAFDPAFSSRVSLGLIHLGYAMENAADHGISSYDFLAGPGRASDYKRHLSQSRRALSCVQMLRGRILPALYRWRDHAR